MRPLVAEGMDEFQLVVECAGGDQRMRVGSGQPVHQAVHQGLHAACGRCHVHQLFALIDADAALAPATGVLDQSVHQLRVRGQQVIEARRLPLRHGFVSGEGVEDLPDLARCSEYRPAGQHGRDLLDRQRVLLDGQ